MAKEIIPARDRIFTVSIVLLTLLSLFYATGFILSFSAFLGGFSVGHKITPFFLYVNIALLIPGYGLFSFWWLLFKFEFIKYTDIPKYIKAGLVIGTIVSAIFAIPSLIMFVMMIRENNIFGLGSQIFTITLFSSPILTTYLMISKTRNN